MSLSQTAHGSVEQKIVGIGLLGHGVVGTGVARALQTRADAIAQHGRAPFRLVRIGVRDLSKHTDVAPGLLTDDSFAVVNDPAIDLVIECIGGTGIARDLVTRALESGKHVVTANKDLLAVDGPRLAALAAARGVSLHYEAAVGGAIPIVRALTDSLAGEEIVEVGGVLNGTTNFILGAMGDGASYASALADAQRRGFAEADPTSDVEGIDAAHKTAILAQLAFRLAVTSPPIARRGITALTRDDISLAARLDMRCKLVGCARLVDGVLFAAVTPAFVRRGHPFAEPAGAHNCIRVIGRDSGSLTFAGAGAGREPTASAVIGDVVAALRRIAGVPAEDPALTPIGNERIPALALRRVVRLASFRDVRAAATVLAAHGIAAEVLADVAAVNTAPLPCDDDGPIVHALASDGIVAASIVPLWDDADHT